VAAGRVPTGGPGDLDVYDVAFLAGGLDRVVDTAVVALVRAGRVRVHSPGHLATADLARRHPVEAAVLDAVGPTGHRSVDTIRWRVLDDDRLLDVGRRLQRAGLLSRRLLRFSHGDHVPAPTREGRRALRAVREEPGGGDAEVRRVALDGREAMSDARLRAEIFEPPTTSLTPPRAGHRSHDVDHSDPKLAAYRRGGSASAAGVYGGIGDHS
jgi:hypothetical protein